MHTDLQPTAVFRPRVDVRVRLTRDGYLVALPDAETFALPEVTSFIWRALDGKRTVAGVASMVADEYAVDSSEALADTLEVVQALLEMGVLNDLTPAATPPNPRWEAS
ncbi:hypothetical protein GCM10010172_34690 [Paractinoplanes ferrugineus]